MKLLAPFLIALFSVNGLATSVVPNLKSLYENSAGDEHIVSVDESDDLEETSSFFSSQEQLFPHEPQLEDIYQTSSLDCAFLAPLANLLDSRGPDFIRNIIQEHEDGMVYVRLYNPRSKMYHIYKLKPVRDNSTDTFNLRYKFTSKSALWVHLLERAFAYHLIAVQGTEFPLSTSERGIPVAFSFQSLLGDELDDCRFRSTREHPIRSFDDLRRAFEQSRGLAVIACDPSRPAPSGFMTRHAYALISGQREEGNNNNEPQISCFNTNQRRFLLSPFRDQDYTRISISVAMLLAHFIVIYPVFGSKSK